MKGRCWSTQALIEDVMLGKAHPVNTKRAPFRITDMR